MSLKTKIFSILVLSLVTNFGLIDNSLADERLFTTWQGLELDKCASAWLIKKFIDQQATFKFYPKGDLIDEGIPFDTPDAELRRYHNMSTFESILKKYSLKDPVLLEIGSIIHDIEINFWGRKKNNQSRKINHDIVEIINLSRDETEGLEKSFRYFEELYQKTRIGKSSIK